MTVKSSKTKRRSLLDRMQQHKKTASKEKNGPPDGAEPPFQDAPPNEDDDVRQGEEEEEEESNGRTLYFNQPLPNDMLDEEGHPSQEFARNKIRTARYTPLSFIPKNLFFQFHNIANIFFLFLIILGVSRVKHPES